MTTTPTLPRKTALPNTAKQETCCGDTRSVQPLHSRLLTESDDENLQNGMMSEPDLLLLAAIEPQLNQQPKRQLTERYTALKSKAGPRLRDGKTTRFFQFSLKQLRENTPLNQHLSQAQSLFKQKDYFSALCTFHSASLTFGFNESTPFAEVMAMTESRSKTRECLLFCALKSAECYLKLH